jgi:hypothetical protein
MSTTSRRETLDYLVRIRYDEVHAGLIGAISALCLPGPYRRLVRIPERREEFCFFSSRAGVGQISQAVALQGKGDGNDLQREIREGLHYRQSAVIIIEADGGLILGADNDFNACEEIYQQARQACKANRELTAELAVLHSAADPVEA